MVTRPAPVFVGLYLASWLPYPHSGCWVQVFRWHAQVAAGVRW